MFFDTSVNYLQLFLEQELQPRSLDFAFFKMLNKARLAGYKFVKLDTLEQDLRRDWVSNSTCKLDLLYHLCLLVIPKKC